MKLGNKLIAFTFLGGFIGTASRYLLDLIPGIAFANYWVVNLVGAVAIAAFKEINWFNTAERKALFITGFAAVSLKASRDAPQAKVLSKPFHLRDLVSEVQRMLAA